MDSSKVKTAPSVTIRGGKVEDAQTLGRICYEAFTAIANQHNFPTDFSNVEAGVGLISMLLNRPDVYSVVAELEGRTIGSNFLWEGDTVVGVGPITVDVNVQNSSVGRTLMADVIKRADDRNAYSTRLVQSAYHNRSLSLYTKLGFDAVEPLSMIQGTPVNAVIEGTTARSMTRSDVTYADELSIRVHGHTRHGEVIGAVEQGSATIVERAGRITGYTTGIGFFGHAVAETNDDLKALIAAATVYSGPGFLLPTRNGEVLRWCLENGLRIIQPLTLMSKGSYQEPRGAILPSILY
jgi:GNAT superfamily N-acetyltransferase